MSQGEGGGHPLKFRSVYELQKAIDRYFRKCDKEGEPYTLSGFALGLDTYRDVINDYKSGIYDDEVNKFSNLINRAHERIAKMRENGLQNGKINAAAGIFLLKNHNFTDKQEIDMHVTGSLSLVDLAKKAEDKAEDEENPENNG